MAQPPTMFRNHPLVTDLSRVPALFLSTDFKFIRMHQSSLSTVWAQAPAESLAETYKTMHLAHADSTSRWGQGPWTRSCERKTLFTVLFSLLFLSPTLLVPLKANFILFSFNKHIRIIDYIFITLAVLFCSLSSVYVRNSVIPNIPHNNTNMQVSIIPS